MMERELVEREVLRLVVMHDDGEHEPHEVEQCGIFLSAADVRSYVTKRFDEHRSFRAVPHGEPDDLAWTLFKGDSDSDLVLIVWRETLHLSESNAGEDRGRVQGSLASCAKR